MKDLLAHLDRPKTLRELATELKAPEEMALFLLERLAAKGYVELAYEGNPSCEACATCSLRRLCPGKEGGLSFRVFRLTEKGERALKR